MSGRSPDKPTGPPMPQASQLPRGGRPVAAEVHGTSLLTVNVAESFPANNSMSTPLEAPPLVEKAEGRPLPLPSSTTLLAPEKLESTPVPALRSAELEDMEANLENEMPPLTNASMALAEFTSILHPNVGNSYLKEHILHLLERVDTEDTLIQIAQRLEGETGSKSAISEMTFVSASTVLANGSDLRDKRLSHSSVSRQTQQSHERNSLNSGSTFSEERNLVFDNQSFIKSHALYGRQEASVCSQQSSALAQDPLEMEEPALPEVVRREGRRVAVSAAPLAMRDLQSFRTTAHQKSVDEERQLTRLVRNCHLFSSMEEEELVEVVRAMVREEHAAGTAVLEQGLEPKEKLFLVFEGSCEAIKNGRPVGTITVGATFGELELMYKQATNAATVRCVTNCVLYALDEVTYHRAVLQDSLQKRKRFQELTSNVPFLRCLPDYERLKIAEALVCKTYKRGQYIIKFGQKGSYMHCIISGTVKVMGRNQGHRVEVVRLGPNDVVGELEFLFDHLTVADVLVTSKKCVTACISRNHFELIAGPIQDRLKEFVRTSPTYEAYYIKEAADPSVRSELSRMESSKRARRIDSKDTEGAAANLKDVDKQGEIVLLVEPTSNEVVGKSEAVYYAKADERGDGKGASEAARLFRFSLSIILNTSNTIVLGIRADGLIVSWNSVMERLTNYAASDAMGQNIYSFLLEEKQQKLMYKSIVNARDYAGNIEGFISDIGIRKRPYTLARSDGLTKALVELAVVPPLVSTGGEAADVLLAFGSEVKDGPQQALDQAQWLSGQIRALISDPERTQTDKLVLINDALTNFEAMYRAMTVSTERLRVVNIRQMVGQLLMDFGGDCVSRGLAFRQRFEGLPTEKAYLDAELLPECLRYAMNTCINSYNNTTITITITLTEKNGLEFLIINFNTDGDGFPPEFESVCDKGGGDLASEVTSVSTPSKGKPGSVARHAIQQFRRVYSAVENQGGTLRVKNGMNDSNMVFLIPYMGANDNAADNAPVELSQTELDSQISLSTEAHLLAKAPCETSGTTEDMPASAWPPLGRTGAAETTAPVESADESAHPSYNFTTLVAEDTPAHRNMLCTFLWERKHAVLPAYTMADIDRLSGAVDILVVDLQQSIFSTMDSGEDPISVLREKSRQMAIIITSRDFDLVSTDTYHKAGFITLKKPCTPVQALQAIRLAEEKIYAVKKEAERIAQTRETLAKNSRGAWKRGRLLGKGTFGEVFEAVDVLTGGTMAVKEMRLGKNNLKIEQFVDEISTMCNLQHPNIIHYFYCEESAADNVIRVFMEFAPGGTVQGLLSKGKLDFRRAQKLLQDVTEGLAYIHAQHYVHGDIKTANVLLGNDGVGKIGDFGTARTVSSGQLLYEMQGSPLYMSPECMSAGELDEDGTKIGYSFPSDVWSLGCVAMEMFTNKPPFAHIPLKGPAGLTNYITGLSDTPDLSPFFDMPPSVTEFVSACLNPDPSKRPTVQELLHMSLFSEATDEQTKSAVQALKRAQLLHVLNQFVAFQDPEEEAAKEAARQREHRTVKKKDFFDSSSSGGSSSSSDGGSSSGKVSDDTAVIEFPPAGERSAPKTKKESSRETDNGADSHSGSDSDDDEPAVKPPSDVSPTPKKRSKTVQPGDEKKDKTPSPPPPPPGQPSLSSATSTTASSASSPTHGDLKRTARAAQAEVARSQVSGRPAILSRLPAPTSAADGSSSAPPHRPASDDSLRAAPVTNVSFAPINASFYNYSFNKNISFLGANLDDVLNGAANDFLSHLAAGQPANFSSSVDQRTSPDRPSAGGPLPSLHKGSRSPSTRSLDKQAPLPRLAPSTSSAFSEDVKEGSGVRPISRPHLARPGVVNKSFFVVEDCVPVLSNLSMARPGGVHTTTTTNLTSTNNTTTNHGSSSNHSAYEGGREWRVRELPGGRRAAVLAEELPPGPVPLTEETLEKHQLMYEGDGDEEDQETKSAGFLSMQSGIKSRSSDSSIFVRIEETLCQIRGEVTALLPRTASLSTVAVQPMPTPLATQQEKKKDADSARGGGNPLDSTHEADEEEGRASMNSSKGSAMPGRPPTVPHIDPNRLASPGPVEVGYTHTPHASASPSAQRLRRVLQQVSALLHYVENERKAHNETPTHVPPVMQRLTPEENRLLEFIAHLSPAVESRASSEMLSMEESKQGATKPQEEVKGDAP